MAWNTTLVLIVRGLISDLGASPVYTDERVEQSILIGGLYASQEFPFSADYTFDFDTPNLSPDPTLPDTMDKVAMALFSLKAACILNTNSYQGAVGTGIKVRDGDSEVDTTGSFKGYDTILKVGPCGSFDALVKTLYARNSAGATGRAVTTPQNLNSFYGATSFGNSRDFWNGFAY